MLINCQVNDIVLLMQTMTVLGKLSCIKLKLHVFDLLYICWWRRGVAVERRIRDREVAGSSLGRALRRKNSGQVSHTYG